MDSRMQALTPAVGQALVRTAEDGRQSLFLSSHASHIVGWSHNDGRKLLNRLYEFACQEKFMYRHHWQDADLLIWDNRCTMHRAVPFDDLGQKRDMRRATVNESGPERSITDCEER